MGSPASASTGGSPLAYIPQAQPQADQSYQAILNPLVGLGQGSNAAIGFDTGGIGPAAFNYPQASNFLNTYGFNPQLISGAQSGAQSVADYTSGQLFPMGMGNASQLSGLAGGLSPYINQSLMQGYDPTYTSAISQLQNNPFYGQAQAGAQQGLGGAFGAAGLGAQAANTLGPLAQQLAFSGQQPGQALTQGGASIFGQATNPLYQQLTNAASSNPFYGDALTGASYARDSGLQGAQQMFGAGSSLLQSGFDPQSALFNRSQQQLMDQSQAANAAAGIGSTPYGASATANALGNFDINWQNQQLARQAQAAGAASPLFQAAPGLAAASGAAPSQAYMNQLGNIGQELGQQLNAGIQGLGAYGTAAQQGQNLNLAGAQGASNLFNQAAGLEGTTASNLATAANLPSNLFTSQIGQVLQALQARNQGGTQGTAQATSLLGGLGGGLSSAQNLGGLAASQLGTSSQLPYQTGTGIANNAINSLGQLTNLGTQGFYPGQQAMNDLQSYLNLGQSATALGGNLGQMGFNQLSQGLGGGLAGANALFGGNGLLTGGGLLGGLGGLGGSGALGAGADAAAGASAAAGGGGGLGSFLPFLGAGS